MHIESASTRTKLFIETSIEEMQISFKVQEKQHVCAHFA